MNITYYTKSNYGTEQFYIIDESIASSIKKLTGRITLTASDMKAFESLGHIFTETLKPRQ